MTALALVTLLLLLLVRARRPATRAPDHEFSRPPEIGPVHWS